MKSKELIQAIKNISLNLGEIKIMEVCGTHTVSIFRNGIRSLLPKNIKLISGPGCPICVTDSYDIDKAIWLSMQKDVILLTYGDLFKVPGSKESLSSVRANGYDIRIIYSALDCIKIAKENPSKRIVFIAVGFETTAPGTAVLLQKAHKDNCKNLSVFSLHKTVPFAIEKLLESKDIKLNGLILPGHVSSITGVNPYNFISRKYKIPAVISGFESLDILESLLLILKMIKSSKPEIKNQYGRVVSKEGNKEAQSMINIFFDKADVNWRGLGVIKNSGLLLNKKYDQFNAEKNFKINVKKSLENKACKCGEIIQGLKLPKDCKLFGNICNPQKPVGPCMVSSEGTCAAYYKYN